MNLFISLEKKLVIVGETQTFKNSITWSQIFNMRQHSRISQRETSVVVRPHMWANSLWYHEEIEALVQHQTN